MACSTPQTGPKAPASGATSSEPQPASDALVQAMAALPRQPSPLSLLPADLEQQFRQRVDSLEPDARQALLDDPALAAARPWLHLSAGGQSLIAYSALYGTPAGSNELVELRLRQGKLDDLPEVVNRAARVAALHVLRERARDLDSPEAVADQPKPSPETKPADAERAPVRQAQVQILEQVARAAVSAQQPELERQILQRLILADPSPRADAALSRYYAEQGQAEAATRLLSALRSAGEPGLQRLEEKVAAAQRIAEAPKPTDFESALQTARAHLLLGQGQASLALLEPHQAQLGKHLSYTTAYARALADGAACPFLLPSIGNVYLCAAGWHQLRAQFDFTKLTAAWQAGAGRSPQAVEEYLGMMHVVPMTYGVADLQHPISPQAFFDALSNLQRDSADAAVLAPYFRAMSSLAGALSAALEAANSAAPGERAGVPEQRRQKLLVDVQALQADLLGEFWGQAAALGMLAVLTPDEDVSSPLSKMQPVVLPKFAGPLGALTLWQVLANGDQEAYEQSKQLLSKIVDAELDSSFERSRWLLLWAEAEAHIHPNQQSFTAVASMSQRLLSPGVPLSMRLRARLNLAGIRARGGDYVAAASVLEPIVSGTPRSSVGSRLEQELLVAATGYLIVLRALAAEGDERQAQAQQLEQLLLSVTQKSAAPPSLRLWLALWRGELEYLLRRAKCAGNAYCEKQAAKVRGMSIAKMDEAVGKRTAQLLRRGILTIGGVEIKFSYQPNGSLLPELTIDSRFLLAHTPPEVAH